MLNSRLGLAINEEGDRRPASATSGRTARCASDWTCLAKRLHVSANSRYRLGVSTRTKPPVHESRSDCIRALCRDYYAISRDSCAATSDETDMELAVVSFIAEWR